MPRFLDTEFDQFLHATYSHARPDKDQVERLRGAFYAGSVFTLDRHAIASQLLQEHFAFINECRAKLNLPGKD